MRNESTPDLNRKNHRARIAALVSSLPGVMTGGVVAGAAFEASQATPAAAAEKQAPTLQEALAKSGELAAQAKHRWMGVLDLHEPTKTNHGGISFLGLPDGEMGASASSDFSAFNYTNKPIKYFEHHIIPDPVIQKVNGKDYFLIYYFDPYEHNPFTFFWLNIKKAQQLGAIDCYSYTNSKSGVVNYKMSSNNLPFVEHDSAAYNASFGGGIKEGASSVDRLSSVVLPKLGDPKAKTYQLKHTSCPSL